jgi:hypothetical protein
MELSSSQIFQGINDKIVPLFIEAPWFWIAFAVPSICLIIRILTSSKVRDGIDNIRHYISG